MMYEIWSEGFRVMEASATASLEGKIDAEDFTDACIKLLGDRLDKEADGSHKLSVWGCRLFDNEHAARASFG